MDFGTAYTAISRVTDARRLFRLPDLTGEGYEHLLRLTPDPAYSAWLAAMKAKPLDTRLNRLQILSTAAHVVKESRRPRAKLAPKASAQTAQQVFTRTPTEAFQKIASIPNPISTARAPRKGGIELTGVKNVRSTQCYAIAPLRLLLHFCAADILTSPVVSDWFRTQVNAMLTPIGTAATRGATVLRITTSVFGNMALQQNASDEFLFALFENEPSLQRLFEVEQIPRMQCVHTGAPVPDRVAPRIVEGPIPVTLLEGRNIKLSDFVSAQGHEELPKHYAVEAWCTCGDNACKLFREERNLACTGVCGHRRIERRHFGAHEDLANIFFSPEDVSVPICAFRQQMQLCYHRLWTVTHGPDATTLDSYLQGTRGCVQHPRGMFTREYNCNACAACNARLEPFTNAVLELLPQQFCSGVRLIRRYDKYVTTSKYLWFSVPRKTLLDGVCNINLEVEETIDVVAQDGTVQQYTLRGIVEFMGEDDAGHYVAWARHGINNWMLWNDDNAPAAATRFPFHKLSAEFLYERCDVARPLPTVQEAAAAAAAAEEAAAAAAADGPSSDEEPPDKMHRHDAVTSVYDGIKNRTFLPIPLSFSSHDLHLLQQLESEDTNLDLPTHFTHSLSFVSLKSVFGSNLLNDTVINCYGAMIEKTTGVCFLGSFFYTILCQNSESASRRCTSKDVFAFSKALAPINVDSNHWTSVIIDVDKCTIEYLDSLGAGGTLVLQRILAFLQFRYEEKRAVIGGRGGVVSRKQQAFNNALLQNPRLPEKAPNQWTLLQPLKSVPQQNNQVDCGVFTSQFCLCRALGMPLDKFVSQAAMPFFRQLMALELYTGALLPRSERKD